MRTLYYVLEGNHKVDFSYNVEIVYFYPITRYCVNNSFLPSNHNTF